MKLIDNSDFDRQIPDSVSTSISFSISLEEDEKFKYRRKILNLGKYPFKIYRNDNETTFEYYHKWNGFRSLKKLIPAQTGIKASEIDRYKAVNGVDNLIGHHIVERIGVSRLKEIFFKNALPRFFQELVDEKAKAKAALLECLNKFEITELSERAGFKFTAIEIAIDKKCPIGFDLRKPSVLEFSLADQIKDFEAGFYASEDGKRSPSLPQVDSARKGYLERSIPYIQADLNDKSKLVIYCKERPFYRKTKQKHFTEVIRIERRLLSPKIKKGARPPWYEPYLYFEGESKMISNFESLFNLNFAFLKDNLANIDIELDENILRPAKFLIEQLFPTNSVSVCHYLLEGNKSISIDVVTQLGLHENAKFAVAKGILRKPTGRNGLFYLLDEKRVKEILSIPSIPWDDPIKLMKFDLLNTPQFSDDDL